MASFPEGRSWDRRKVLPSRAITWPLGQLADAIHPVHEVVSELVRVNATEHPRKGVRAGNPVGQIQKSLKPFVFALDEQLHVVPPLSTPNDRADGHRNDVQELMPFPLIPSAILQISKMLHQAAAPAATHSHPTPHFLLTYLNPTTLPLYSENAFALGPEETRKCFGGFGLNRTALVSTTLAQKELHHDQRREGPAHAYLIDVGELDPNGDLEAQFLDWYQVRQGQVSGEVHYKAVLEAARIRERAFEEGRRAGLSEAAAKMGWEKVATRPGLHPFHGPRPRDGELTSGIPR